MRMKSADGFRGGGLKGVVVFGCDVAEQGPAFGCLRLNILVPSRDIVMRCGRAESEEGA
jgi:hypothetical protein